jgi:hypothetical protein
MTWMARAFVGALLTVLTAVPVVLHADTVQLSLLDGRVSLIATNATPAQIFDAWSRAGGIVVVNVERMPATPITLQLENVPEEQALDIILRPVSGYLARRRVDSEPRSASVFDRIVILATPAGPRPAVTPPAPAAPGQSRPAAAAASQPVFPQAPPRPVFPPQQQPQSTAETPTGIPQAPGVTRLVGPDGQPVEDDQAGAPGPRIYTPGDAPDARPIPPRGTISPPPPAQLPAQLPGAAPAGVPRPGMLVPSPQPQNQPPQR